MKIAETKIELAKRLLATDDKDLINHIKAVFDTQEDWYDTLPDEMKASLQISLEQAKKGQTIPHAEVMKKYQKWLKK